MEKDKILEYLEELKGGLDNDLLDLFNSAIDYDEGYYICDIITEASDYKVDIYTSDLLDFAKENYEYIEYALDEFGTPKNSSGNADFIKILQQGEFYYYNELFYENIEEFYKYFALNYIYNNNINIDDIDDVLDDIYIKIDNNNTLDDIIEIIKNHTII